MGLGIEHEWKMATEHSHDNTVKRLKQQGGGRENGKEEKEKGTMAANTILMTGPW